MCTSQHQNVQLTTSHIITHTCTHDIILHMHCSYTWSWFIQSSCSNYLSTLIVAILYSVNFWQRKPWRIWWITGGSPNFTIQILTMSHDINKKQTNRILPKFYLPKVSDGKFTKVFIIAIQYSCQSLNYFYLTNREII